MDRVTGWYKKSTRTTLRIIAIVIVTCFNVNLIKVTQAVNNDDKLKTY